jgi:hypothetical protein
MCHQSDCSGGQHASVLGGGWRHHRGCCCDTGYTQRHFPTKEESIEELQEYLKQLKAEAKGVEERIAEFRKGS